MLEKYFKGFPEKQALKGTLATVLAYKGSKYLANQIGEKMSKPSADGLPAKAGAKEKWEFVSSAIATVGSIYSYNKIKSKDIGFGLVLGTGLNLVDKFALIPEVNKSIPDSIKPLFLGNDNDYVSQDSYIQRVNEARTNLSEEEIKSIVNAAKVNGYLDGFEYDNQDEFAGDTIYITPEERAALINANMVGEDNQLENSQKTIPEYDSYVRPDDLGDDDLGDDDLGDDDLGGDDLGGDDLGGDDEFA